MTTLFVSDLHLSILRPEKLALFMRLMTGPAIKADAFYILGDLFDDFWIGCDDEYYPNQEVISILREYSANSSTKLFIMRGNRDFHLNQEFANATSCTLIEDPTEIILDDQKVLLLHGDTLCTDDVKYQKWRRFITNPFVKWLYSVMSLKLRTHISRKVRGYSVEAVQKKAPEIIDVTKKSVLDTLKKFNVNTLIHGHTHRQARHEIKLNDTRAIRFVLGEWFEKDCVLVHDKKKFRFERVDDYVKQHELTQSS
ncbi:MAG: UDP-2,3-diacylglucosamine diphosphatase [Legionellales bacterium]|nr:UDP-2,3-diacylglucosamine diphosphatase [Legionellales bacterium]|tara:strand:+ start:2280 stop:3041 length:762 start_codon:yes stop_codon:yes gene_type:complete